MRIEWNGDVAIGTTTANHKLDVNGNIGLAASSYINWGATDGTTGYGFRDNNGVVEYKNSGGAWTALNAGTDTNFAAGTVGAPGLYVTGDTNTGLYEATADTLSVTAGGTEVARFNTTASAVNYFTFAPSVGTSTVTMATAGTGATVPITLDAKGTSSITLVDAVTLGSTLTLGNTSAISFGSGVSDKLVLYGNTYGIGIERSTLTSWSGANHRWRGHRRAPAPSPCPPPAPAPRSRSPSMPRAPAPSRWWMPPRSAARFR